MNGDKNGGDVFVPQVSQSDMDSLLGKLIERGEGQLKRLAGLSKALDSREVNRVDIDRMISQMVGGSKLLLDGLGRLSRNMWYYGMRAPSRAAQASCGPVEAAPRGLHTFVYGKGGVDCSEVSGDPPVDNEADGMDSKLADLWDAASGMLDVLEGMRKLK